MDKKNTINGIKVINATDINPSVLEILNIRVRNLRKYRSKIETRKQKINRLYE